MTIVAPRLVSQPLATWEREGLVATLRKAGLPVEGVHEAGPLFWRFQTEDDVPVGFGGLQMHGADAVLRSIVTLPPMRRRGIGAVMVAAMEGEAALLKARTIWLRTAACADFFARLGYAACDSGTVPPQIRASASFAAAGAAIVMVKRL